MLEIRASLGGFKDDQQLPNSRTGIAVKSAESVLQAIRTRAEANDEAWGITDIERISLQAAAGVLAESWSEITVLQWNMGRADIVERMVGRAQLRRAS